MPARERYRRAPRRGRIRGDDRELHRTPGRDRSRAEDPSRPGEAVLRGRPGVPHVREHRDQHLPGRRRGRGDAREKRRHRDVPRQGPGAQQLPVLLGADEQAHLRAPSDGIKPAPRRGAQRVPAALSAQARPAHRRHCRRGSAGALEASRLGHGLPGAIHSARRGNRPDRADRRMGSEDGVRTEQAVARSGHSRRARRGQPLGPPIRAKDPSARRRQDHRTERTDTRIPGAGNHRKHGDAECRARDRDPAKTESDGGEPRDRRLRHRLLLARLPEALPHRLYQDRPLLHKGHSRRRRRHGDHQGRDRARPQPAAQSGRRGRGNCRTARFPAGQRLRRISGIFLQQAACRGGGDDTTEKSRAETPFDSRRHAENGLGPAKAECQSPCTADFQSREEQFMQMQSEGKPVEEIVAAIRALDLEPIKFKLMDTEEGQGWSREYVEQIAIAYKRFLTLSVKYPEETIAPSKDVDKFWHGHILDTMKYAEDCQNVFGYFLHHFPYFGMRGEEDAANLAEAGKTTNRLYEKEFGEAVQTQAGYCAVAKPAASDAAYCAVAKKAAYCAVSKPAYCAVAKKAAYCAVAKTAANDAAYCAVSNVNRDK